MRKHLGSVISDLENIMMEDSMFVSAESSGGYENDPYIIQVHNRHQHLSRIAEELKSIHEEWGF